MNNIYEAKYSKVKKVVGNIGMGDVKMVRVPHNDSIKLILRHSKKVVTIQEMSMDAYWQDLADQGLSSEKIGWMKAIDEDGLAEFSSRHAPLSA